MTRGGLHSGAARPCRLPAAPLLVPTLLDLLFKLPTSPTSSRPGQVITDTKFSAPEAHIIPAVKFTFTLLGAALRRPLRAVATPSQRRLMALIGLLDACAYTVYCLGWSPRPSRCCSVVRGCCCCSAALPSIPDRAATGGCPPGTLFSPSAAALPGHAAVSSLHPALLFYTGLAPGCAQAFSRAGPRSPTCCCREWARC